MLLKLSIKLFGVVILIICVMTPGTFIGSFCHLIPKGFVLLCFFFLLKIQSTFLQFWWD